jgi:hypothetical protein
MSEELPVVLLLEHLLVLILVHGLVLESLDTAITLVQRLLKLGRLLRVRLAHVVPVHQRVEHVQLNNIKPHIILI